MKEYASFDEEEREKLIGMVWPIKDFRCF